jgi:hypothetical protein
MYLLNYVKDNRQRSTAYGSYIRPGTVIRCDGRERKGLDKPDLSATFISFPYFDVGHGDPLEAPRNKEFHVTRSLFQQMYPQENTQDRDDDQQFRRFRQTQKGQYLRVPQLWVLIINSAITITCGPTSLAEITEGWLEIMPDKSFVSTQRCLIHVTDFYKRVTCLFAEQCRSFLELRHTIQEQCLSKTDEHIDDCILHLGDNEGPLDPSSWPSLLKNTRSAFLYVRVSLKGSEVPLREEQTTHSDDSDVSKIIEYTDLQSDDEPGLDDKVKVYVYR